MKMRALLLASAFMVVGAVGVSAQVIIGGNGGSGGGGGPPTGAAGGDLTGTYPNPALASVNSNPGTYGDESTCIKDMAVSAKGLITAITEAACNTGAGDITAVVAGAGLTGGATSGSATLSANALINAQTGTSYTIDATDAAKLVTLSNGSAIAVTVPQATTTFGAGFSFGVSNKGAGAATLTPTTSLIAGAATLVIRQNQSCWITSDGTDWQVDSCSALPIASATLAAVLTDETGSGAAVFATTPTLVTPVLGVATGTSIALGGCTIGSLSLCTNGAYTAGGNIMAGASSQLGFQTRGFFTSPGGGFMQMGTNAASPVAQTFYPADASGTNGAGASTFTFRGSMSTGNANSGDIVFQTGVKNGGSNSTAATPTAALTIKGETQTVQVASGKALQLGNTYVNTPATMTGTLLLTDAAGNIYKIPACLASGC